MKPTPEKKLEQKLKALASSTAQRIRRVRFVLKEQEKARKAGIARKHWTKL